MAQGNVYTVAVLNNEAPFAIEGVIQSEIYRNQKR